jgi:hypothetical protein
MPISIPPPVASATVTWGIALLAVAVALWIVWAVGRGSEGSGSSRPRLVAAIALAFWMAVTWQLAARGVLARFDRMPPPFAIAVLLSVVAAAALGLSGLGRRMALALSFAVLVGAQAFRLPLELVMHRAAAEGVMPPQMTYTGSNFDIVSGALALLLLPWLARGTAPRGLLWLWNVLGATLLFNVVGVAIVSLPPIHNFGTAPEKLNTWVAFPPFVWLPTILVPAALLGHILVTRKLLASRQPR